MRWPDDRELLERIDRSFVTEAFYSVTMTPLSVSLERTRISPPLRKDYPVDLAELAQSTVVLIAEHDGVIVGVAAMNYESWNRRASIGHLYVDARRRGTGIGSALLGELPREARQLGARCLWVETQAVNAPAIHFYQRRGFTLCGLDTSLYDPVALPGEVAVFFTLPLTGE